MENKTILEWFELAKELGYEWADAAIANYENKADQTPISSLKQALEDAFGWWGTAEGIDYWCNVYNNIN